MRRAIWFLVAVAMALPAVCGAQDVAQKQHRIPLEGSPSTGPLNAPVTVVEFVDYQSQACQAAVPSLKRILEAYRGRIRLVIKNMPGASLDAHTAAKAALAAGSQGKYWEMHDQLLSPGAKLDREGLVRAAERIGLDLQRFETDLDGPRHIEWLEQDKALAAALGVSTTPVFFVNGRRVAGPSDFDSLKAAIDQELALVKP